MGKLLRADLFRAFRCKIFYILLALNAVVAVFAVGNQIPWAAVDPNVNAFSVLLEGFGGGVAFLGILNAVLVSVFVGHEYGCGALRNKVMTGGGRTRIYLSKLIVCCAMCAAVYAAYHLVNFLLGSAVFGWQGVSFSEVILAFTAGLCMSLASCAILTGVSMLSKNIVVSLLVGVLGTIVVLVCVMWLLGELQGSYVRDPLDPEGAILVPCNWPAWLQTAVRWLLRLIPTGQSVLLAGGTLAAGEYGALIALSCAWLALSAVLGPLLFRRIDLK